ncbi:MAG: hypothetical protein CMO35_09015 [Verrucomicrobiaceae bacterium]|nr:hypothetical protein [Verrucomicrobiaceae bacterium]
MRIAVLFALSVLLAGGDIMAEERGGERWLKKSGYGLMFHYEAFRKHSAQSYNEAVDSFDVNRFVNAVADTNAGHVIFVIGQHWGRYCAPNSAYEKLLGVGNGVWTSKRDLILEIGEELAERDVHLIIYMTARAPMRHYEVIKAMNDTLPSINGKPAGPGVDPMSNARKIKGFRRSENQAPTAAFLKNWGEVCGEWSRRYGRLVAGWWFDGYKTEMGDAYKSLQKEKYNIDTWVQAVLSGNPAAELAFNAGAHPILSLCTRGKLCPHQTFTSGENHGFHQRIKKGQGKLLTPVNFPAPEGVIWHLLLPVGEGWGAGEVSRFDLATLKDRIDHINSENGVVTLDVPVAADGRIPPRILRTLVELGKESASLRDGIRSY